MSWGYTTKRKTKYGASKVSLDGYSFHSKLEAATYQLLKLRVAAGEIASIQCQDQVYLTEARVRYIADFKCTLPDGSFLWVESKGFAAARWPDLKKLWRFYGPGTLEIWGGNYDRPTLLEIIKSKGLK